MRLIDSDALIAKFKDDLENLQEFAFQLATIGAINTVKHQPTVDAVPVRHGKWIYGNDFHWYTASCNKCGYQRKTDIKAEGWNQWKYCPNCGADMRGEQDERLNKQTGGD